MVLYSVVAPSLDVYVNNVTCFRLKRTRTGGTLVFDENIAYYFYPD